MNVTLREKSGGGGIPTGDLKGYETIPMIHLCEKCGKREILTPEAGFKAGWDMAPYMYPFRTISPRTCGQCSIKDTAWWAIAVEGKGLADLTEKQAKAVRRILAEPESLLLQGDGTE